jgi:hypothetical protein
MFENIDQVVIQQQFTTSPKDFILLCDITWKKKFHDPEQRLHEIKHGIKYINDIIVISNDKNHTLCFLKGVHDERYTELFSYTTKEFLCFIEYPIQINEEFGILNLVGLPNDVERLIEFMRNFGSGFEVIAVKNYYPGEKGILSALTDKQLSILKKAYKSGFFEYPRKNSARKISKKIGIAHTTFLTHIRKSQKRILSVLFE